MDKKFEIKVYWIDWTFKNTLKWSERITDISFTSQINWWQGESTIELNKPLEDTTYSSWDFARVYVFNDIYPNWYLIYTWIIQRIERKFQNWNEYISLICLWLASLLNFVQYNATKNQDPWQTLKDIIDFFNTKYSWNWIKYDWWFINNYWSNINITFTNQNCFESINNLVKTTNFWWYIRADWQVYFKAYPIKPNHYTTAWKDLESLNIQEDSERIYNKVYVKYNWWNSVYQDNTSISTYWLKEIYKDQSSTLNNLASADIYWNTFLNQNKDPKQKITMVVNDYFKTIGYTLWDDTNIWNDLDIWEDYSWINWIEHLNPWDTITVRNLNYSIQNKQINKVNYQVDRVSIELSEFDTLWKEILN